jgi:hypothetical protein
VRRDRAKHQIRLVRFPDGEQQRMSRISQRAVAASAPSACASRWSPVRCSHARHACASGLAATR